jgi:enoyl-CoA hydratase
MASAFSITREGPVAVLTHDDGKANTFVQTTFEDLIRAFEEIEKSDAGAVLYRGRPGYFGAGLNLKVLPSLSPEQWVPLLERFGEAVLKVFLFPRPVVAEVTGHAIGGGAIFAYSCDVRFFNKGAFKFGLNEVPNGLPVPGFGVEVARAATRMSDQMELICHGRMINPDEALEMRIATAIADDSHAMALERARALAELPSSSYAATKRNLRAALAESVRGQTSAEAKAFVAAMSGKK